MNIQNMRRMNLFASQLRSNTVHALDAPHRQLFQYSRDVSSIRLGSCFVASSMCIQAQNLYDHTEAMKW